MSVANLLPLGFAFGFWKCPLLRCAPATWDAAHDREDSAMATLKFRGLDAIHYSVDNLPLLGDGS